MQVVENTEVIHSEVPGLLIWPCSENWGFGEVLDETAQPVSQQEPHRPIETESTPIFQTVLCPIPNTAYHIWTQAQSSNAFYSSDESEEPCRSVEYTAARRRSPSDSSTDGGERPTQHPRTTEKGVYATEVGFYLDECPGLKVIDEPDENLYPLAIEAVGEDEVLVGRVREDESVENGLNLWVTTDNIKKGGALNAVQIAEVLVWND